MAMPMVDVVPELERVVHLFSGRYRPGNHVTLCGAWFHSGDLDFPETTDDLPCCQTCRRRLVESIE